MKITLKKTINIYCDAGVQNNGKKDCYGACAYIVLINEQYLQESTDTLFDTTNNRAEIQAILNSLHYLNDNRLNTNNVTVHSDSQYCVNGCSTWMYGWAKAGFLRGADNIPNADLWKEMFRLVSNFPNIKFNWVKGHANNEWNNYVNDLCTHKQNKMKEYV